MNRPNPRRYARLVQRLDDEVFHDELLLPAHPSMFDIKEVDGQLQFKICVTVRRHFMSQDHMLQHKVFGLDCIRQFWLEGKQLDQLIQDGHWHMTHLHR